MDLPIPEKNKEYEEEYKRALKIIADAQNYITMLFGEDAGVDYMIGECKKLTEEGKLSDHCYEYANKTHADLTASQVEKLLPKNADGKPIWSYKDM